MTTAAASEAVEPPVAAADFQFYSEPYVVGMLATYFGRHELKHFVPGADAADVEHGIEHVLREMQLAAEKLGANSCTGFEMTIDQGAEQDGVQGTLLHAWGCMSRLEGRY